MNTFTQPRIPSDLSNLLKLLPFGGETGPEPDNGDGNGNGTRSGPVVPQGYGTEGDILYDARVTQTVDGVDLNLLWAEFKRVLDEFNKHRTAITNIMSSWGTASAVVRSQGDTLTSFEEASEFGIPESLRPPSEFALLGMEFKDYDARTAFSWRFLRDADARQVRAFHDDALNADNKLVTGKILHRLLDPTPGVNKENVPTYGVWSADGMEPPPFRGKVFDGDHTHYLVSGANTVDAGDLELGVKHIREHGVALNDSSQKLICLCSESSSEIIQGFRAGVEGQNGITPKWDFIKAITEPAFILQDAGQLVGKQPPGTIFDLASVGSYGPIAAVVETEFVPDEYLVILASSGGGASSNVVGVREHRIPSYRGLRQIPGPQSNYPLTESFYSRSFGTGVLNRSGAIVFQLKEDGDYEPPIVPF